MISCYATDSVSGAVLQCSKSQQTLKRSMLSQDQAKPLFPYIVFLDQAPESALITR